MRTDGLDLAALEAERVDFRFKAFPPTGATVGEVGRQGWDALGGDLSPPLVLVRSSALDHNIALMASYAREHGVLLAPHAKTPLAPQVVDMQLRAGAWGITVANLHQARVLREFGVRRILIANQVLDAVSLRWISGEIAGGAELSCLVDSVEGVERMQAALPGGVLPVLLEAGLPGARCGVRTLDEARAVATAVRDASKLTLAGVETYEAMVGDDMAEVDAFLAGVRAIAEGLLGEGLLPDAGFVLSGGGSSWFDRVVDAFRDGWPVPVRVVIRPGTYIAHDGGDYDRLSPLAGRSSGGPRLRQALELWATVLSVPEPGFAVAGFGKRDVSFDTGLPVPFERRRDGGRTPVRGEVFRLNDQHARMRFSEPDLRPGDLLGFRVHHPCTAFDRWRLVPLVDDDDRVTGAIRTFL